MSKKRAAAIGFTPAALGKIPMRDLAVRFAFGATVSAIAAIIAIMFGSQPSGLLLAFPAILPATLTLIEKEESEKKAEDEDIGAVLGAASLIAFAVVVWQLLPHHSAVAVLTLAGAAWVVTAVLLYLGLRHFRTDRSND